MDVDLRTTSQDIDVPIEKNSKRLVVTIDVPVEKDSMRLVILNDKDGTSAQK
jgi:hypothetical protein